MLEFKSDIDVKLVQHTGSDSTIVSAAKVLTNVSTDPNERLIRYLMRHRHGTPFEHASMTFHVNAPIFVWREWHRHRIGFSYNEESARYKTLSPLFYLPPRDRPMMKVEGWIAGRPKFTKCENEYVYDTLCENFRESYRLAYHNYLQNLALGVDPGLARDCLPVGIYSSCWVTCNPRSLMAFLSLRTSTAGKSYPLYEIEQAAMKCEAEFAKLFPITYSAFNAFERVAP